LILLQAVLGFDNLLYISLESKRAPEADQSRVRKWGIGIAVGLRIVLLFALVKMIPLSKARGLPFPNRGAASLPVHLIFTASWCCSVARLLFTPR
jgi:hypothetical protein